MRRSRRRRLALAGIFTTMVAAASLTGTAGPAQAYNNSNITIKYARVDTDNCARLSGTLPVVAYSDGCRLNDSWDGTFFRKDPNGVAVKIEVYNKGVLVGKAEFHPYDEKLWVYDTRDDSDTLYAILHVTWGPSYGPYRGPVNGYTVKDLDIADNLQVVLVVNDDQDGDELARVTGIA
mgnify:CR=1 FL=1